MPTEPKSLELVLSDLREEGRYLDEIVSRDGVDFFQPTPADGWTIGMQLGHLLWTDRISLLACRDRAGFARQAETFGADPEAIINAGATAEAAVPAGDLLAAWRRARTELSDLLVALPAGVKIPWFGPSMGVGSVAAARLMETWAHGLDITDALGRPPAATSRLRHVADLGVRTRDFAFAIHGRRSPGAPFRIELSGPDGDTWAWGPPDAADRITGSALDFCFLVTQRRHRSDLDLVPTPGMADHWMDIAQAFAGPGGKGRPARVDA